MEQNLFSKLVYLGIGLLLLAIISSGNRIPPILEVDYTEELVGLNQKVKESLTGFSWEEKAQKKIIKQRREDNYKFSWEYNYHKLEVPLFGSEGKLLEDYKEEIINKFEGKFPFIETKWIKDHKQKLTIKIGFSAQTGLELITHKLEFIQPLPEAKMAVVIDDFGFNRRGTERIVNIKRPLTLAVLPSRPFSEHDAKLARKTPHEIILHQPLEPMNPKTDPGEGAIYTEMSEDEIKAVVNDNLASLPPVVGVNNHMGSKATADQRVMEAVMEVLKEKNIFYLDSSTAPDSKAPEAAQKKGVPIAVNYLFIDNIDDKEEVKEMILSLGKTALKKKELVIFGHVRENTARALEETIPKLEKMGIKLVHVSKLVK